MASDKIARGGLVYHAVHGLCRLERMIKQEQSGGKEVLCYSLVPKIAQRMKSRFIIAVADIKASGFHALVSPQGANDILQYLKAGDSAALPANVSPEIISTFVQPNQTWSLAQVLLSSSQDKFEAKDQRKRQMLQRSAKGLVGELAFVLNITVKETVARIRKSLGNALKINPSVLIALDDAGEA